MKFNHNGVIVDAFQYGIDIIPKWFENLCCKKLITQNEDDSCIIHNEFPMIGKIWDYIVLEENWSCYAVNPKEFQCTAYPIYDGTNEKTEMFYYWEDKVRRARQAHKHVEEMCKLRSNDIERSVKDSCVYRNQKIINICSNNHITRYTLFLDNTVDTLYCIIKMMNCGIIDIGKIGILNYASFKNPGGGFLSGSNAQEESLCHHSTLFNVLSRFKDTYYIPNMKMLNNGLYTNDILYTPNIIFINDKLPRVLADVITCAAPNKTAIIKYKKNISEEVINNTMRERIDHVLYTSYINNVETLILGPFGCGVFGNNPEFVAKTMKELLDTKYYGVFKHIIFSLPIYSKNTDNTMAFWKIFSE